MSGRSGKLLASALLACSSVALAACTSSSPSVPVAPATKSKEYFSEAAYGVKASPRVTTKRSRLPRGGGRDQVGKPYKIKGKWYYPKEDPDYRKSGTASWYGDAFHGRLTANGEIYDMTHLTAAHPTMPLPSYARVTNKANGSSVIVRVNDRGPYAHGRIIDLSRRAAEMLDYTHLGVAKVDVEYLGRAPLHGQDDAFLMASYKPGNAVPDPSDGMPTGVMIAMAGPTPTEPGGAAVAFTSALGASAAAFPAAPATVPGGDLELPAAGPIIPERPGFGIASILGHTPEGGVLAYADRRVRGAAAAVAAFAQAGSNEAELVRALNEHYAAGLRDAAGEYVAVGTYPDRETAQVMARALADAGKVRIETDFERDGYVLSVFPDGRVAVDDILRTAWAAGASGAMTIRQ